MDVTGRKLSYCICSLLILLLFVLVFLLFSITHARETRVTAILAHILIGLSLLMLPIPLQWIPRPVLDGLFIYLAVTALGSNQMFERITLLLTEQVNNFSIFYTIKQE